MAEDLHQPAADLAAAKRLLGEWAQIAQSIARQCKWRPQRQCYIHCQGLAVCRLDGLTLVDERGRPVLLAGPEGTHGIP